MTPLTAALLLSSRALWEQAHACIQNLPVRIVLEQNDPGSPDELLDRLERHRVDVVLLEVSRLALPLEELVRRIKDTSSQPAVFVLHPEASSRHILEALRAGAAEFLYPPLIEPLREAFERLSAARAKSANPSFGALGRVFGFISAKGGSGATTFAAHVAAGVSRQVQAQTLLADFDFDAGLLRFIMKAKTSYSVRDALENMHRMDSSYWKALVSSLPNRLDVIPAPEELAAKRSPGTQEITPLLRFIRSVYPISIVDFGRHVSPTALDSLPEIDTLYLVTTLELETLDHARDCIRAATERGFPSSRLKVLLNRLPEKGAPDPKGIENFLGTPADAVFTSDYMSLYDAWSEGRLLDANTKLGRELNALSSSVIARVRGERPAEREEQKSAPGRTPGGIKRLFSFLQKS
ncbi:MAG TPA: hypothetical protein VHB50_15880 [Bryobacteraceae bacterium]|nr:hypothetical protein [Bryobacteraceae bacterium]